MNDRISRLRVGVFDLYDTAEKATQGLVDAGFDRARISVICSDRTVRAKFPDFETRPPSGERESEFALRGTSIGALVGGATGIALATTGGAALFIAGALATLAGAGAGTFIGAMTARGVEREVADYYDQALDDGRILVAVDTADEGDAEARRVFTEAGARPIRIPGD